MTEQELAALIDKRTQEGIDKALAEQTKKYGAIHTPGSAAPAGSQKELPLEVKFGRWVKTAILGKGDPEKAAFWAKKMYEEDKGLNEGWAKALTVTSPLDGGFLVPAALATEIIPFLYAAAVVRKAGARTVDLPSGNLSIPRLNSPTQFSWVGESKPAPKNQPQFGDVRLSAKKAMTLVPISNDLIRSASAAADAFVTGDIATIMALGLDLAALYGTGNQYQPAGIATQLAEVTGTPNLLLNPAVTLTQDIPATVVGKLLAGNVPMNSCGWIINGYVWAFLFNLKTTTGAYIYRAEMESGKLLGYPFFITNQLYSAGPTLANDFFFGDFSEFLWGTQMELKIDTSQDASYSTTGTNDTSAFANDQTIIRAISLVDFNLRHPASFVQAQYKLS